MSIFCLVNGSTQDPRCWNLLVPELEKRGQQTVTPSLPVDEPAASGTRYAEVIAQALEDAGDDVVLVGHSASGMFIPLVPSLRPIRRLVYLAALIPQPGASIREQLAVEPDMLNPEWLAAFRAGNDPSTNDDVAIKFLFHDCPPEAMSLGLATRTRMYAEGAMTEIFPLEALPEVPSSYIVCSDDRTITPQWSRRTARERLGVEAVELPGGHCPYLSIPSHLADVLLKMLD
ncbi:MAG TPA: alpha/beta hydrolase [Pyrinomonadaceae bacterium]|jgi:pimeloyl-ACP methyl ester carboxylesterase|nr:alpha/beta hydrolase [Pyrinomonadaceae bacterium]